MRCALLMLLAVALVRAEPPPPEPAAWSARRPDVTRAVAAGRPLVVSVVVPLCSNAQIDCGASWAGQPGRPETNIYWGAIYGARRFFERPKSGYERVSLEQFKGQPVVERAVYRRRFDGAPWGRSIEVEQIVVLEAVHGDHIDGAVGSFWGLATSQRTVSFEDQGRRRTESVHVAGYAGHNRLMDGLALPAPPAADDDRARAGAIPSFVLACYSDKYFSSSLQQAGSTPLVTTRALMAPEGYLIHAIAEGLAQNLTVQELRRRTVQSYARWQRISERVARRTFTP
jgi:hypothetical protein